MDVAERITRVDGEKVEVMKNYAGTTRDSIILAREAGQRIVADDLRSIELIQDGKDYRIEVRARR